MSYFVKRTWDALRIGEAVDFFLEQTPEKVDPIEWLSDPSNIALENQYGDLGMFEYGFQGKKIYSAHYHFRSKGRQAITSAHQILDELFNSCYNISILMGLTPIRHKAARWFNRQLGATSYGIEDVRGSQSELFILTKKEFNDGFNPL